MRLRDAVGSRSDRSELGLRSVIAVLAAVLLCFVPGVAGAARGDKPAGSDEPSGDRAKSTQQVDTTDSDHCDFLDRAVCLQPWPNDYFTIKDSSTDTGRRLNLERDAMPKNFERKSIENSDYNRNDGFSPGSPIITKVPGLDTFKAFRKTGAVPITDMGRYDDRHQAIVVIDADSARRHPIWSEIDANPEDREDVNLIIRPSVNLREGHRYIVALRHLKDADGHTIPASEAFRVYRDDIDTDQPEVEARRKHFESLFRTLKRADIERKSLFLAWDFTVGSERSISERELAIRNDAFRQLGDRDLSDLKVKGRAPEFTVEKVTEDPDGPTGEIARKIEGSVTVPCYLNLPKCPSGSRFVFSSGSTHGPPELRPIPENTNQARYTCQIPRVALEGPRSRPSLYGHGCSAAALRSARASSKPSARNTT